MSDTKQHDPALVEQVTPELTEAVEAKSADGRINCETLRKLAEDTGVSYKVAGTAADLAGIRIHNCGLGCF